MAGLGEYSHLSIQNSSKHSKLLISSLQRYYETKFAYKENISASDCSPVDFAQLFGDIEHFNLQTHLTQNIELESGSEHFAKIVNIKHYGLICEIYGKIGRASC